jgi:hypothetical protein
MLANAPGEVIVLRPAPDGEGEDLATPTPSRASARA